MDGSELVYAEGLMTDEIADECRFIFHAVGSWNKWKVMVAMLQVCMCVRQSERARRARVHTRTRARARTHTHTHTHTCLCARVLSHTHAKTAMRD